MGKSRLFTLWIILIVAATILAAPVLAGAFKNSKKALNDSKITPIKGIIIVCSGQENTEECDEAYLGHFFNNSPIKILTRKHLKAIFEEQSLQMSGLTEREKSEKLGKILGASHILLFKTISDQLGFYVDYTLINIHSSEIEYHIQARDVYTGKSKIKFFTSAHFFSILDQHAAK